MKYKTLFRLMLKAVGVLLFVQGCFYLINYGGRFLVLLAQGPGYSLSGLGLGGLTASFTQMIIGLYLFFGGKWVVDKAIPGNRPYCHECGYDLTGLKRNRCPECDTPFNPDEVRPSAMFVETDDPA